MGALDDAIREHLELKRQHGASDEEVEQQEKDALELGALPSEEHDFRSAQDEPRPSGGAVEEPAEPSRATLAEPEQPGESVAPEEPATSQALSDELEPDDVLPGEALELDETPALDQASARERPDDSDPDAANGWMPENQPNGDIQAEDVLEETPEFLEETPEHDRLWFEQRPPKDFDFDD